MTLAPAAPAAPARVEPAVALRGVTHVVGSPAAPVTVLDRVSLDVAPGEFVSVVGASGCGKTTLLSLIAGLDRPTTGEVAVAGRSALMFQEAALFPWLSAGRNVELALRLRGVPRPERGQEVRRLLRLVHLEHAEHRRPHQLSGGMRQRVALARALAQGCSVLLMDEPFSALDAITRDALHEELTRVWVEAGLTVVFVTHNVREAVRLGQRVVLLSSRPGRVAGVFPVTAPHPRRIESPEVGEASLAITERLREEIRRHA